MDTTAYHEETKGTKIAKESRYKEHLRALRILRAVVISVCSIVLLGRAVVSAETIDRVLAVVTGQLITLSDVTAARDLGLQSADGTPDPIRAVLVKLIDRELILAEVDRYAPPEPSTDAVDREVQRVRERFPSQAALDAALARSGIDQRHLREMLRDDLRIRTYLDQRFATAADRREALVEEWLAGLRRRGDISDLYLSAR
jgi:hypothetical protein